MYRGGRSRRSRRLTPLPRWLKESLHGRQDTRPGRPTSARWHVPGWAGHRRHIGQRGGERPGLLAGQDPLLWGVNSVSNLSQLSVVAGPLGGRRLIRPRRSPCPVPSSSQVLVRRSASFRARSAGLPPRSWVGLPSPLPSSVPGVKPEQVDYVFMGQVILAGTGPDHRPPGGSQGRHPHDRARHHREQGLPVGPQRHLPGRPAHQCRRRRDRGGRRHGVDDPGALPPSRGPGRLPDRGRRRWSTR